MKTINILLIEDDPLDVISIRRNLDKLELQYMLNVAVNGERAIAYMDHLKDYRRTLPDLILIDINMPRMNGFEFLNTIRNTSAYEKIKCFVLTGSNQIVDRETAELLGISGYLVKPLKISDRKSMESMTLIADMMKISATSS